MSVELVKIKLKRGPEKRALTQTTQHNVIRGNPVAVANRL